MARKPVPRRLPGLKDLFPGTRAFRPKDHQLELATEKIRIAALRLRKKQNQPFYSMRESARFWGVPLPTILTAYQRLEDEGLIVRVRGSRTVLLGKSDQSQHPARSIVTVPVALSSLVSSHFTRRFCDRISDELWRFHFVANLMLVRQMDDASASFARRLVNQSDIVIWLFPNRSVKETLLTARDHGVRNIVLQATEELSLPVNYAMDWTTIYLRVLLEWKTAGVSHVVVPRPTIRGYQAVHDNFLRILRDVDLPFTIAEPTARNLREKVERLRKRKPHVGCVLLEHTLSHQLCYNEADVIANLTRQCRLLFGRGRVHAPQLARDNVRADVIGFDGDDIAVRVANDLGRRLGEGKVTRLLPRHQANANFGELFT